MNKHHLVYFRVYLLIVCILAVSLLLPGCGGGKAVTTQPAPETSVSETSGPPPTTTSPTTTQTSTPGTTPAPGTSEPPPTTNLVQPSQTTEPGIVVPYTQIMVGNQINRLSESGCGAAWGPNTIKIASCENSVFTYVMDCSVVPWQVILYSKEVGGVWQEGESISLGNPPNIFVDSQGFVHLIGHESFAADRIQGRLVHIKFNQSNTVSGPYISEYITPDTRTTDWALDTVSNIYNGAAIGEDDTILVAYQASMNYPAPPHAILARIYDPITKEWSFETVTTNLSTRFCYPFAAVSEGYFHVLVVEDEADETLLSPYRFGIVKHFQRARNSDKWVESTLIDFTTEIDANPEVNDVLWLRTMDLFVDSSGTVHVMIRYNKNWSQGKTGDWKNTAFHYWKAEGAVEWHSEQAIDEDCIWLKFWEREDGQLFYVYARMNRQIDLIPFGTNQHYTISDLNSPYNINPVPFIAIPRSGTNPGSTLDLIIFSETEETRAIFISCDVSDL